ncbi:MAG: hypothetical protein AUK31_06415 [Fibrobacteres bacterium CG2_30_45_31]|nr:MAG: hypothetical protein AUK31_06415 [Fibrobacteres bacterium CG2_30_45_31]
MFLFGLFTLMKMLVRGISSLYIMGEALPVCFGFEKGCWIKPLHKVNRKRLNFIDHPWTVMLSMAVFLCVFENHPLSRWFRISLLAILSDTRVAYFCMNGFPN